MYKNIKKIKFILSVLDLFSLRKKVLMTYLLEELNAENPETRFLKAELRRTSEFEAQFLKFMESFDADLPDNSDPMHYVNVITGEIEF